RDSCDTQREEPGCVHMLAGGRRSSAITEEILLIEGYNPAPSTTSCYQSHLPVQPLLVQEHSQRQLPSSGSPCPCTSALKS
ncbi:hypothetical protein NDU88_005003, partial [Pleurodeles waltl]